LRIGEVRAGAERLALRGQHGGADIDVLVEVFQRIRDLVDQRDVEEIQRRLSDLDQADVAVLLDADVRVLAHLSISVNRTVAAALVNSLSRRERVGVRGYGLSLVRNPSPDILASLEHRPLP